MNVTERMKNDYSGPEVIARDEKTENSSDGCEADENTALSKPPTVSRKR